MSRSVDVRGARSFRLFAISLALGALAITNPAHAESDVDRARTLVKTGLDHFKSNHFVEARDEFVAAYKLYPHDSILLNLGLAHEKTGEFVEAERELMRYIADYAAATPEEIATARATLSDVRGHLGTLRLRVTPSNARVLIDDKPVPLTAGDTTELRLIAGDRNVSVDAKDFVAKKERVHVDTSRVEALEIKLDPMPVTPARAVNRFELSSVGLAFAGAGIVSLGFTIFSGVHTLDLNSDYQSNHDPGTRHEGLTFRAITDVSGILTIGFLGAGAYLIFKKGAETRETAGGNSSTAFGSVRLEPNGVIRF